MNNKSKKVSRLAYELEILLSMQIQFGNIKSQEKKEYLERLATGMVDDLRKSIRFFDKTLGEVLESEKLRTSKDTILNEMVNKMRF